MLGDRIEAATLLAAAAGTGGQIEVKGCSQEALKATLDVLIEAGCEVSETSGAIILKGPANLKSFSFVTAPFPGLATDMQPLLMALACKASGVSKIEEKIFESRFGHIAEYRRFGAEIEVAGREATVKAASSLQGASAHAGDIRAAAGLVLMGLFSEGLTSVFGIHHLDRGYDKLEHKLSMLGARISRTPVYEDKELVIGC